MFFRIEPGDLVVHSYDLQHGVHVWKGARYSLIFWVKDSLQAVRDRSTPWYLSRLSNGAIMAFTEITEFAQTRQYTSSAEEYTQIDF